MHFLVRMLSHLSENSIFVTFDFDPFILKSITLYFASYVRYCFDIFTDDVNTICIFVQQNE